MAKARREVAECQRFRELGEQLLDVNEQICQLRPVEEPPSSAQEKTAEVIQKEVAREVDRFLCLVFQERRRNGRLDLEAVETALRSAMHQAGASALTQLLRYEPPEADHRTIPCACGHLAYYKELRPKTVLTVVGPVELRPLITLATTAAKAITRWTPNWASPV